jgi:hypothetical protein
MASLGLMVRLGLLGGVLELGSIDAPFWDGI